MYCKLESMKMKNTTWLCIVYTVLNINNDNNNNNNNIIYFLQGHRDMDMSYINRGVSRVKITLVKITIQWVRKKRFRYLFRAVQNLIF